MKAMFDSPGPERPARRALFCNIGSYGSAMIPAARRCNSARNSRILNLMARAAVSARLSFGPGTMPKGGEDPIVAELLSSTLAHEPSLDDGLVAVDLAVPRCQ